MVHWPGDPDVQINQQQMDVEGVVVHLTSINMSAHTGTHMDAPLHFVNGGSSMDAWTPVATIGAVRVIAIEDRTAIRASELERHALQPGERVLFRTANSETDWVGEPFKKRFVYIAHDTAEYLVAKSVRTVGVDYLSIGGYVHDMVATHVAMLTAGIWVIEGLNLGGVSPGTYDMVCLPLRLKGADGSPARVLLRRLR
jgi:arylformamidase